MEIRKKLLAGLIKNYRKPEGLIGDRAAEALTTIGLIYLPRAETASFALTNCLSRFWEETELRRSHCGQPEGTIGQYSDLASPA
jgi:hypothetical protein